MSARERDVVVVIFTMVIFEFLNALLPIVVKVEGNVISPVADNLPALRKASELIVVNEVNLENSKASSFGQSLKALLPIPVKPIEELSTTTLSNLSQLTKAELPNVPVIVDAKVTVTTLSQSSKAEVPNAPLIFDGIVTLVKLSQFLKASVCILT